MFSFAVAFVLCHMLYPISEILRLGPKFDIFQMDLVAVACARIHQRLKYKLPSEHNHGAEPADQRHAVYAWSVLCKKAVVPDFGVLVFPYAEERPLLPRASPRPASLGGDVCQREL